MPQAASYIDSKTSVPSDMRTAQWAAVPVWCREKSFWVAGLDKADTLAGMREKVRGIAAGKYSRDEARALIKDILDETEYQSPEGMEGTIKDLRSNQRLDVMINTNVDMAQGWAYEQSMKGSLVFPGKTLVRIRNSRQPRDWDARWEAAASSVGYEGVARNGRKIALATSPIWKALSAFGNEFPPFDYNSGMGVEYVEYDTCREAGLITDDNEEEVLAEQLAQRPRSMNEGLEAKRDYREQDLRDSLSDSLKGLARWEGNVLKFTDPNGTAPYDWREVGPVISAELPETIPNLQADALRHWVEDHSAFEGTTEGTGKAGWDEREDFSRLVHRINPESAESLGTTLYRGMTVSNDILENWLDNDLYTTRDGKLVDSWAVTPEGAGKYVKRNVDTDSRHNVLLVMNDYEDVRPIHAAVRSVGGINSPKPTQILETDGEVLTLPRYGYEILKKITDRETGLVVLSVRQQRRKRK